MYYKWKIQGAVMETLTVCKNLTEMPIDETRVLSNDQKSWVQSGNVIEVGKAVVSVPFAVLWIVNHKKLKIIGICFEEKFVKNRK